MAQKLSRAELIKLYRSKKKGNESAPSTDIVTGNSVLERLEKISYVNSLREVCPRVSVDYDRKTIAICLVIVDDLPHEGIWRAWIEQASSKYKAQLFIHAKHPDRIQSPWVRSRTLDKTFSPEWNSPEVIRAMLATLSWALDDKSCGRFVFGTESCIPVCTLQEVGDELFALERSWLDAYHRPKDSYEEHYCFYAVDPKIVPSKNVWKALPGWVMLTRRHAEEVVALPARAGTDDLVLAWNTVHAPEEVYFPTMLSLLGFLRDNGQSGDEVERRRVTFATWAKKGDANPVRFPSLTADLIQRFRDAGSLFGRKFAGGSVSVDVWVRLVGGGLEVAGNDDSRLTERAFAHSAESTCCASDAALGDAPRVDDKRSNVEESSDNTVVSSCQIDDNPDGHVGKKRRVESL